MGLRDFPPLPAPGCRGYDHGKVRGSGYSWALTVASSSVRFLGFGYGFLARMASKTPGGRGGFYPRAGPGPTLSGRINLFPLPRSSRGGSYFL